MSTLTKPIHTPAVKHQHSTKRQARWMARQTSYHPNASNNKRKWLIDAIRQPNPHTTPRTCWSSHSSQSEKIARILHFSQLKYLITLLNSSKLKKKHKSKTNHKRYRMKVQSQLSNLNLQIKQFDLHEYTTDFSRYWSQKSSPANTAHPSDQTNQARIHPLDVNLQKLRPVQTDVLVCLFQTGIESLRMAIQY